jgi:hypothetical protein
MRSYTRETAGRTGSFIRKPDYWAWMLDGLAAARRITPDGVRIAEGTDGSGGYVFLHRSTSDALELWEAAAPDGELTRALLADSLECARRQGCSRLDIKLPLDHGLVAAALAAGARIYQYSYGIFARLLDLRGLLQTLEPVLSARLRGSRYESWNGILTLETDIGCAALRIQGGLVSVEDPSRHDSHSVAIPQHLLVKLVTGFADLRWVAGTLRAQGVTLPEKTLPILAQFFPKACPYIWLADSGY